MARCLGLLLVVAAVVAQAARPLSSVGNSASQHGPRCERERHFIKKILAKFGGVEHALLGEGKSFGLDDDRGKPAASIIQQGGDAALSRLLAPQGPSGEGLLGEEAATTKEKVVAHEKATEEALRAVESACESSQKASSHLKATESKKGGSGAAIKASSSEVPELKEKLKVSESAKRELKPRANNEDVSEKVIKLEASLAKSEARKTAALTLLVQKDKLLNASTFSVKSQELQKSFQHRLKTAELDLKTKSDELKAEKVKGDKSVRWRYTPKRSCERP